jgi:hypothetical protein
VVWPQGPGSRDEIAPVGPLHGCAGCAHGQQHLPGISAGLVKKKGLDTQQPSFGAVGAETPLSGASDTVVPSVKITPDMCLFPRYFTSHPEDLLSADLNFADDVTATEMEWKLDASGTPTMISKAIKGKPITTVAALTRGLLKLPAWGATHRPAYWTPVVLRQHSEHALAILRMVEKGVKVQLAVKYDEVFRYHLHRRSNPAISSFASFDIKLYQTFFLLTNLKGGGGGGVDSDSDTTATERTRRQQQTKKKQDNPQDQAFMEEMTADKNKQHDGAEICRKYNMGRCKGKCKDSRAHVCYRCTKPGHTLKNCRESAP